MSDHAEFYETKKPKPASQQITKMKQALKNNKKPWFLKNSIKRLNNPISV